MFAFFCSLWISCFVMCISGMDLDFSRFLLGNPKVEEKLLRGETSYGGHNGIWFLQLKI